MNGSFPLDCVYPLASIDNLAFRRFLLTDFSPFHLISMLYIASMLVSMIG
jgi:hypothetical protein